MTLVEVDIVLKLIYLDTSYGLSEFKMMSDYMAEDGIATSFMRYFSYAVHA